METTVKPESKYERLRRIGIGSYGVVFKCVNRQTGQIVAIKRYSENDTDPIIRKIAMREVRMLRQLKHPNLINLIEVFRRKRRLHLVFDYCELTVLDVIEKYTNNCPLNLIKKIIWQTVNGINYCHTHNCIHRDIKPENILINQAGVVKLCDFGFARNIVKPANADGQLASGGPLQMSQVALKSPQVGQPEEAGESWRAGALGRERQALTEYVATRWYRAPELLIGEVYYDIKIDIWAIGCVTAELMRGEPIWPGKTDVDQLCIIKSSLGQLTSLQAQTLLTQSIYDQPTIEKIIAQAASANDCLERKLPGGRVGSSGVDFVSACLQMDPSRRPTSEELLRHLYIQSARMSQFVISQQSQQVPEVVQREGGEAGMNSALLAGAFNLKQLQENGSERGKSNSQSLMLLAAAGGNSNNSKRTPDFSTKIVEPNRKSSLQGSSITMVKAARQKAPAKQSITATGKHSTIGLPASRSQPLTTATSNNNHLSTTSKVCQRANNNKGNNNDGIDLNGPSNTTKFSRDSRLESYKLKESAVSLSPLSSKHKQHRKASNPGQQEGMENKNVDLSDCLEGSSFGKSSSRKPIKR